MSTRPLDGKSPRYHAGQQNRKSERLGCIFCGGLPLSKEHIFANWMRPYLFAGNDQSFHSTNIRRPLSSGERVVVRENHTMRAGDQRAQKLRVVCRTCNNGWMSTLQVDVRPYLQPLLQGRWGHLSVKAQAIVSAWACMFTMVYERADAATAAIEQADRSAFCEQRAIQPRWMVWLSRGDPHYGTQLCTIHRGWGLAALGDTVDRCNAQITVSNPNELCFVTLSGAAVAWDCMTDAKTSHFEREHGLLRVWPPIERNIFSVHHQLRLVDEAEAMRIVERAENLFM